MSAAGRPGERHAALDPAVGVLANANAVPLDQLSASERSASWRTRFLLREWVAGSLFVIPTLYMAAALALAEILPRIEGSRDVLSLNFENDTARTFYSAVAGGMIAFTGLVVSIAVVVVQFGASQYTPRLVSRFRRDPIVKHALGAFIAPAIFSLVSLGSIGRNGATVVPSVAITVALALLLGAVLAFYGLVGRLLDLLRPRRIVGQIVDHATRAIREAYPFALRDAPTPAVAAYPPVTTVVRHEGRPGVVSALDRARLVRAATAGGAVIEVRFGIGGYVPAGADLFAIRGAAEAVDRVELRKGVILAEERTITQDPAFALRAIVDIALRALSPAVNDPTTAVQALDGIDTLLLEFAVRDLERGRITGEDGALRLVHPNMVWEDLLDLSLTEIRHYGADTPQIARRMRALLLGLAEEAPAARRHELDDHLARLDAAVRAAYPDAAERAYAETADHLGIGGGHH
jgi:uncharacterized membrane protein